MTATLLPAPTRSRGAQARAPRLDSLTGMRFVAALAVFVHHTTGLAPGSGLAQAPVLFPYSTMGVNGVGFFFVLSGFLLAWGHRPGTRRGLFYWRRAGRIWPAHLAATIPCVWVFYLWGGVPTDAFSFVTSLLLVQTWFPGVVPMFPGNGVAWTLSVEVFFYLLFPWVIGPALRLRTRTLALLAASGLAAMWAVNWWAAAHLSPFAREWVMRHPVTRLPEFAAGLVCAIALRRGHRIALRPAVLLAAFAAYTAVYCHRADWLPPGAVGQLEWTVRPFVAVFSALFIVAYAQRELSGRRGALCSRPMVLLGAWSYAFYLLHQTLNRYVHDTWGPMRPDNSALFALCGLAVAVVALSWALFTYVEEPARKWWSRRTPRRLAR